MTVVKKTNCEIEDLRDDAEEIVYAGEGSKYPGMSYEEGIADTLRWLVDDGDRPLECD